MLRKLIKALVPHTLFERIEPFGHLCEAVMWQVMMGFPAKHMKVIGVTGTDGKTTTSTMIYALLNDAGVKTGLMTTIGYGTPEHWRDNYVHMTTVSTRELLRRIKALKAEGITWLVLETTSHALAQNRVWGIPYSIAVLTNVTHEHLDYHKTFERYRDAKAKLFRLTAANERGLQAGIINRDDPSAEYFEKATKMVITYGLEAPEADMRPSDVKSNAFGSTYRLQAEGRDLQIKLFLPGTFNVYNSLAAVSVGLLLGLSGDKIEHGLASLKQVDGRMNRLDEGQDFSVIVDFAHTPDSFDKIFSQMKQLSKGRLIGVFGSAGRRDEAKRFKQGASAGKYADIVVLTEEDDRDIDGFKILHQIAEGVTAEGKVIDESLFLIHDRTEAITFAINEARPGDTVLLLGKGHEKTIEGPDGERQWDETATAQAAIRAKMKSKSS